MRPFRPGLLLSLALVVSPSLAAQQSTSTAVGAPTSGPQTPQAASILQQSLTALTGGAPVTDVTMTGTVTRTIGTLTESGTFTMVATSSGQGQVTYNFPTGGYTQIRYESSGSQTLSGTGADGQLHAVHTRSILSPHPAWFFPAFVLNGGLSSTDYASSYAGQETRNGSAVQHVSIWLLNNSTLGLSSTALKVLSQQDVYLDATTHLPVAMTATVHPYNANEPDVSLGTRRAPWIDSQSEVRFSDYRRVAGRPVAYHIQVYLDEKLASDIQVSSVTLNTGATVATN